MTWIALLTLLACDVTRARMLAEPLECPAGTEERVQSRGLGGGWTRSCLRYEPAPGGRQYAIKHGPNRQWDGGRKVVDGHYADGRQHGRWTFWREDDGSLARVQDWDRGELVGETRYARDGTVEFTTASP